MNQGRSPRANAAPPPPSTMPREESSSSSSYGTYFLGRYRVVDEIGVGGMASVHLARMDGAGGFQKWVAIKRIHPHLIEDEQFIHMFLDEARIAARISHPNVAQVFDLGQHENTYWIAMEYLHGEPLREVMRHNEETNVATSPILSARIIADAAEGLHAAHELKGKRGEPLNLVHRDVSPHNLFVTYDGMVKVVDFGIAKVSGGLSSTRAGTLKGKLAYMSPEQVSGAAIDRRTDIFALGVVLWELVTGRRLFRMDSDLDTLQKVQACVVPPPSTIRREVPAELETVILRALRPQAGERYQTAREMSRALHQFLMRAGSFVGPEEVGAYVTGMFSDRISKREEHLRWAAEVTQTISLESLQNGESSAPSVEEISVQSLHGETAPTAALGRPANPSPAFSEDAATRAFQSPAKHAALPPMPKPPPAHGIHRPAPRAPAAVSQQPVNAVEINAPSFPVPDDYDDDDEEDIATVVVQSRSALMEEAQQRGLIPAAGSPAPAPAPNRRAPTVAPRGAPAPFQPPGTAPAPLPSPAPQQPPGATPITPEMAAAYGLPPGTYVLPADETMQLAAVRRNNTVVYIAAALGTFFVVISIAIIVLLRARLQAPPVPAPTGSTAQQTATPTKTTAAPTTTNVAPKPAPSPTQTQAAATTTQAPVPAKPSPVKPAPKKPSTTKTSSHHSTKPKPVHHTTSSSTSSKPGFLSVMCSPACDAVIVGGRNRGPSPVISLPLKPGNYSIILRRRGSSTKVIPATIRSGKTTGRRVSMN